MVVLDWCMVILDCRSLVASLSMARRLVMSYYDQDKMTALTTHVNSLQALVDMEKWEDASGLCAVISLIALDIKDRLPKFISSTEQGSLEI